MHTHTAISTLRHFAREHDELPAFHAGYLVLTVITAGLLNLGAFFLLIAAHFSLDLVKYREVHDLSWGQTLEASLREGLLDFFLLMTALTFSVYIRNAIGIAAVSGIIRSDLTLARFAGVFLPKFEMLHRFLGILLNIGRHLRTIHLRIGQRLTSSERLQLFLLTASLILLLAAPVILHQSATTIGGIVAHEMLPDSFIQRF